jgi:uncharacterized protein (TIGR02147 family)
MNVFDYTDYRAFLKDYFELKKSEHSRYSLRFFAKSAGFSSTGYLSMIVSGQRNISPASISKLAKALNLKKKESTYFEALVLFNQSQKDKERDYYFDRLQSLRPKEKLDRIEQDQLEFYSKKYFVTIHQMMLVPGFESDPAWIATHLSPPITPSEVQHALDVMTRLKIIKKDRKGNYSHTAKSLATAPEIDSFYVYQYHRDMLNDAKAALVEVPPLDRDITSLTIPIPKDKIPKFKKKIQDFREDLIDWINKGSEDFHEVYQLNIQLFPTTKTKKSLKK